MNASVLKEDSSALLPMVFWQKMNQSFCFENSVLPSEGIEHVAANIFAFLSGGRPLHWQREENHLIILALQPNYYLLKKYRQIHYTQL